MPENQLAGLASALAANRLAGVYSDLPLSFVASKSEAYWVQSAALDAFDNDFEGYTLVGTSAASRRTLGLKEPIRAAIANRAYHDEDMRLRLPQGMVGAQCELALTIGQAFPGPDQAIDRRSVAEAIVLCQPAIGLLGRRARPGPDAELAAIADFGLHVATICGRQAKHVDPLGLDKANLVARLNGQTVFTCEAGASIGHPLDALVWLAVELSRQGKRLNAGDIVTTGSCTPILQVLPGQHLTVEFEGLGTASCRLE